jgi:hypothetical protein
MTAQTAGRGRPGRPPGKKVTAPNKTAPGPTNNLQSSPVEEETVLIHFVETGFAAFTYTWFAGQELEVERGSADFLRTCDANGDSWLDQSEEEQLTRYNKVFFKKGPSDIPNPIINYEVNSEERLNEFGNGVTTFAGLWNSKAHLEIAAQKELARGRTVPRD